MALTEQQKAQYFLTSIYKKAWEDSVFKKNLIKKPLETLNKFTGKEGNVPEGKILVVEDQTNPNHIYLNIPAKPNNYGNTELSDNQLEDISGASGSTTTIDWNYVVHGIKSVVRSWS
ncbi:TOMM propeptide domain-containing protein [Kordia sp. TARA_039_SRF]|nr:TOMM propeptide domain-containing protein [Kordia sp. TARA_039_SRF]